MTAPPPVPPRFPGGVATAPEIAAGGACRHPACSCPVDAGRSYCCRACARDTADADAACRCGHFGCTDRTF